MTIGRYLPFLYIAFAAAILVAFFVAVVPRSTQNHKVALIKIEDLSPSLPEGQRVPAHPA